MAEGYPDTAKVYATEKLGRLSIRDMLTYFEEHGVMRVSDLHIKVGTPPAYRIDGNLVKLKGITVTTDLAKQLIYPLLSDQNLQKLNSQYSVDCSYRLGKLQFRINVFKENDGICAAVRALSMDFPTTSGRTSSIASRASSSLPASPAPANPPPSHPSSTASAKNTPAESSPSKTLSSTSFNRNTPLSPSARLEETSNPLSTV
jgi:hypothetical protein